MFLNLLTTPDTMPGGQGRAGRLEWQQHLLPDGLNSVPLDAGIRRQNFTDEFPPGSARNKHKA